MATTFAAAKPPAQRRSDQYLSNFKEPEYSNTTYDNENNDEVEELFEDDKSS